MKIIIPIILVIILSSCQNEAQETRELWGITQESEVVEIMSSEDGLSAEEAWVTPWEAERVSEIIPEYLQIQKDGSDLVFERILEQNTSYTRYQISYISEGLKISWVMNIPVWDWEYPLIILNHGYIDPAVYTLGRGLRREQDALARQGFALLHTDYRNHAFSDTDASLQGTGSILRSKKYGADAINAIIAVQKAKKQNISELEHVNPEKVGMLGHSMGGGVTMFALVAAPELINAAILYAPVHSQEWYNFERWRRNSLSSWELQELTSLLWDLNQKEGFRDISPETYFDRIKAPVQMYFGTLDESCPIAWGDDIKKAFQDAGKEFEFIRYEGERHEFSREFQNFIHSSWKFFMENF